jgi:hypothetical protein
MLLYNIKEDRKRKSDSGGHFKLNVGYRILMLLVYYLIYITYTLDNFLFDLDQSNMKGD